MAKFRASLAAHIGHRAITSAGLAAALLVALPTGTYAATRTTKKAAKPTVTTATTAAATTQAPTTAAPTTTATTPATTTVARGGTMVAAISSDPGQLNPAITTSGATHAATELMYNGLVELDAKGRPIPELAESWTVKSGDYTFKLRKGVLWHDGQPFTSDDVKYTFDEVLTKFHARTRASVGDAL